MNPASPQDVAALLAAASQASRHAYAPYSKYHVGCAVLTDDGIFTGANIENAVSNLGICAERVALSQARLAGANTIRGIAVHCADARTKQGEIVDPNETMPCGACRQWMLELAPDAWIVTNGHPDPLSLAQLLPSPFSLPSDR